MSSSATILLLIFLILPTTITATGYIRLDITSSSDADLRLSANLNLDHIRLSNGATTSVMIKPFTGAQDVEVEFSMYDSEVRKVIFALEKFKNPISEVFIFGEVAILVEAEFECDPGFVGKFCKHHKKDRTTTSTTTTTTTTTPTPTTSSEELSAPDAYYFHLYIFAISFAITFLLLLIVISAVFFFCSTRIQNHSQKEDSIFKISKDSEAPASPDASQRYTAAPYTISSV